MVIKSKKVEEPPKPKHKTNMEKAMEVLDEVGSSEFLTLKEGKNTVRILPYKDYVFFRAKLHYGLVRGGRNAAYGCLEMFDDSKECPVCQFQQELTDAGTAAKEKVAQRIRPVTKYYVNVLNRENPGQGIKMFGLSSKMTRTLKGFLEDEDYGDITDIEEGKDIIITREGTSFSKTSYEVRVRAKSTPLDYENWEEEIHDLETEVVQKVTAEFLEARIKELKKVIKEGSAGAEEEEEAEKPKKTSKKPKKEEDEEEEEKGSKEEEEEEDD